MVLHVMRDDAEQRPLMPNNPDLSKERSLQPGTEDARDNSKSNLQSSQRIYRYKKVPLLVICPLLVDVAP